MASSCLLCASSGNHTLFTDESEEGASFHRFKKSKHAMRTLDWLEDFLAEQPEPGESPWPPLASHGLHWPPMASIGLHWPPLASHGLHRGPSDSWHSFQLGHGNIGATITHCNDGRHNCPPALASRSVSELYCRTGRSDMRHACRCDTRRACRCDTRRACRCDPRRACGCDTRSTVCCVV